MIHIRKHKEADKYLELQFKLSKFLQRGMFFFFKVYSYYNLQNPPFFFSRNKLKLSSILEMKNITSVLATAASEAH